MQRMLYEVIYSTVNRRITRVYGPRFRYNTANSRFENKSSGRKYLGQKTEIHNMRSWHPDSTVLAVVYGNRVQSRRHSGLDIIQNAYSLFVLLPGFV